jgi:hypothetical protein
VHEVEVVACLRLANRLPIHARRFHRDVRTLGVLQHTQRIQAVLEEANVKLSSVISDILGLSGRLMLKALIGGETDAQTLAARSAASGLAAAGRR